MINISILNTITIDGEVWKQIPDFPNYLVSNLGRIYSGYKNRIDDGSKNEKGYRIIELRENGHRQKYRISHIVAQSFCNRYADDKHVHHLNRKRDDDRAVNLYPCTDSEHRAIHAVYSLLAKNIDVLAELIEPVIHCNINLIFDDTKGGDAA